MQSYYAAYLKAINTPLILEKKNVPENLKDNEVLIKQDFTGICYRDILTYEGFFPRVKLPIILGHEIAGEVIDVGENVKEIKVGDYVISLIYIPCGKCKNCLEGKENLCKNRLTYGEDINGSYSQYVIAHKNSLIKVTNNIPKEGAVIASCVIGMLIHALKDNAKISKDSTVLITGASGGVGIHAIQVAKSFGAKVIAVTSSPWKIEKIKELNPDYIVEAKNNFSEEIKRITDKEGVDIVCETVGQPTFEESFKSIKWGGKIVVIGNVKVQPASLNLGPLILKEVSIIGSFSSLKRNVLEAIELMKEGKVKPIIHSKIPLEKVNDAFKTIKNKEVIGRILLTF